MKNTTIAIFGYLFSVVFIISVIRQIKTGRMSRMEGDITRENEPLAFWFLIAFEFVFSGFLVWVISNI